MEELFSIFSMPYETFGDRRQMKLKCYTGEKE